MLSGDNRATIETLLEKTLEAQSKGLAVVFQGNLTDDEGYDINFAIGTSEMVVGEALRGGSDVED